MIRLLTNRGHMPPKPTPAAGAMTGPMDDQVLRELQRRNDEKRRAAIANLGADWILHPSRRAK